MTLSMPDYSRTGSEKEILHGILHANRVVILWKLDGLTLEQAASPGVTSGTSLFGLVKHLAWVERWWFCDFIGGQEFEYLWNDDDLDAEWRVEEDETLEWLREFYVEGCAMADEVIEATDLEYTVERGGREPRSLRWVLAHMIEETARHAGHADILREQIDDTVGYFPGE